MRFKQIIGGTKKEVYAKFHWMEKAKFTNAIVDITGEFIVWKSGIWEDGIWESGTWKSGIMWDNLNQDYIKVKYNKLKHIFERVK
jgi:hypothetical protein